MKVFLSGFIRNLRSFKGEIGGGLEENWYFVGKKQLFIKKSGVRGFSYVFFGFSKKFWLFCLFELFSSKGIGLLLLFLEFCLELLKISINSTIKSINTVYQNKACLLIFCVSSQYLAYFLDFLRLFPHFQRNFGLIC